jgi:hypothetical protein
MRHARRLSLALAGLALVAAAPRRAAPSSAVLPVAAQAAAFDHAAFDALLRAHVRDGLVDYDAFARSAEFKAYLDRLAAADPAALGRADQVAFWINAYNAYTIQLVNKHGERRSIRNINKSFGGLVKAYGPWREKLATVGGRAYGLDEIEQDILRKRFQEPRIHFALVCAAMGCPPLRSEAFTGARLDAQLDDQARAFLLRSPEKNRVDVAARTVHLSPIFVGFRDYIKDFGGSEAAVGPLRGALLSAGPERTLLESGDFMVVKTATIGRSTVRRTGARRRRGERGAPAGGRATGGPRARAALLDVARRPVEDEAQRCSRQLGRPSRPSGAYRADDAPPGQRLRRESRDAALRPSPAAAAT